jgi:hypothetical protein
MDEVELLKQLRAGLPEIRDEKRRAARAALMAKAASSSSPASQRASNGSSLLRARGSRRAKLAVAGVGLTTLLVALSISLIGGSGEVQPAVGQVLREAAEVAAAQQPEGPPGPGEYLYNRSVDAYIHTISAAPERSPDGHPCGAGHPCEAVGMWSYLAPSEREVWSSPDERGRVRRVYDEPRFLSEAQRKAWVDAGRPELGEAGRVEDAGLIGGGFIDTSGLPTDPAALRQMIEAREVPGVGGPPGEAETFVLIGDMLRETYLPPAIRAALYELTGELPGVELLGKVRDPIGRAGIGIAYSDERRRTKHELIFDPETSALLGERQVALDPPPRGMGVPPGVEMGSAAYLESGVVDSTEKRPTSR